jgi:hypothetical protein
MADWSGRPEMTTKSIVWASTRQNASQAVLCRPPVYLFTGPRCQMWAKYRGMSGDSFASNMPSRWYTAVHCSRAGGRTRDGIACSRGSGGDPS